MKKIVLILISSLFLFAASSEKKYGKDLTLEEETNIVSVLENPESYVGKRILVKGQVLDVCKKRGCWIQLSAPGDKKLLVKVEDGVIVFPVESRGKMATVEGEIEKIVVQKEHKHEEGHSCDQEGGCQHGETDKDVIYRLKAFGAVIR